MTFRNGSCGRLAALIPSRRGHPSALQSSPPPARGRPGEGKEGGLRQPCPLARVPGTLAKADPTFRPLVQNRAPGQARPLKTASENLPGGALSPRAEERLLWRGFSLPSIHRIWLCFIAHLLLRACIMTWVCPPTPNMLHVWSYVTFATTVKST